MICRTDENCPWPETNLAVIFGIQHTTLHCDRRGRWSISFVFSLWAQIAPGAKKAVAVVRRCAICCKDVVVSSVEWQRAVRKSMVTCCCQATHKQVESRFPAWALYRVLGSGVGCCWRWCWCWATEGATVAIMTKIPKLFASLDVGGRTARVRRRYLLLVSTGCLRVKQRYFSFHAGKPGVEGCLTTASQRKDMRRQRATWSCAPSAGQWHKSCRRPHSHVGLAGRRAGDAGRCWSWWAFQAHQRNDQPRTDGGRG